MKKILQFGMVLLAAIALAAPLLPASVLAAPQTNCAIDANNPEEPTHCDDPALKGGSCAKIDNCALIKNFAQPFLNFLTAFVGVAVVIAIIYGGVEYASSGGDPQKTARGKGRIINAIIALVTYVFFYALLRFILLPGALD